MPPFHMVPSALLALLIAALPANAQDSSASPEPAAQTTPDAAALPDMAVIEQAWARRDYVFVREGLRQLAEQTGTPLAQFRYGRVLLEGRGGPRDIAGAVLWLDRAVAQNHIEAATLLARVLLSADIPDQPRDPERAAALLNRAAARGDAEAQYYLGLLARSGQGMAPDPEAAFTWFLAAAEQGNIAAQYAVAQAYARGEGTKPDPTEGLRWLEEAAGQGHIEAQFSLAQAYDTSQGAAANAQAALRWYRRAAEAGLPLAQRILGTRYLTGTDVTVDATEALRWLTAAAEAGDPGAMFNLGQSYATGAVLPQDDALAFQWYESAADTGLPRAQAVLGQFYEIGRGVPREMDRAIALYRQAAEAGEPAAMQQLGRLAASGALDGKLAPQRAVPWAAAAAAAGNAEAQNWLSARAEDGTHGAAGALGQLLLDTPERQAEALALITRAAEAGDVPAQALLGQAYASGDHGLAQDYVAAHTWLNLAGGAGDGAAAATRDVIAALMTPEQIAEAQTAARALYAGIAAQVPQTEQTVVRP